MTNKEIIEKYLNNENARNNNLRSLDNKLYSYDLLISEIFNNKKLYMIMILTLFKKLQDIEA